MEPKFSGHETFPLRYGWLFKSANLLNIKGNLSTSSAKDVQEAIVELGVGKKDRDEALHDHVVELLLGILQFHHPTGWNDGEVV